MRGFRFLLAYLHCAQRNNHIRFRKARSWKGRQTGTVPTDVLPEGSQSLGGNKHYGEKLEARFQPRVHS